MGQKIEVDFSLLEEDINQLAKLRSKLKKPALSWKLDLVKQFSMGDVTSSAKDLISTTTDYYMAVALLLDNTVKYLKSAQLALQAADQNVAEQMKGC